uniref:Uncharacterized protein n=1 Tax=Anguilla anguilla TaxID=7936 RepID=A0A0E9PR00_ANGAN
MEQKPGTCQHRNE